MIKQFENKFLTSAGQKERLQNVGSTLKASITGKGVQSNTGSKVVNKVLSTAASNPFATALVIATAANPKTALTAIKTAPKTTIAGALAAPVAASIIVSNPQGVSTLAKKTAGVTKDVSNFAGNVANIKNVNDIITTAKENPVLTGAVAIGAGAIVKGGISAISTTLNTMAVRENTKVAAAAGMSSISAGMPALSDNQTKFVPSDSQPSTTAPGKASPSSTSSGAVNIQQNNYYSEKFINSKILKQ